MTDAESSNPDYVDVSVVLKAMLHEGVPMTVAKNVMALLQDDNFATPPTAQRQDGQAVDKSQLADHLWRHLVSLAPKEYGACQHLQRDISMIVGGLKQFYTSPQAPSVDAAAVLEKLDWAAEQVQGGHVCASDAERQRVAIGIRAARAAVAALATQQAQPPTAQRHDEGGLPTWTPERICAVANRVRLAGDEEAASLIELMNAAGIEAEAEILSNARAAHGAGAAVEAVPLSTTYVQKVPDKCDRIIWRGNYHHLPTSAHSPPQQRSEQVAGGGGVDAAARTLVAKIRLIHDDPDYKSVWVLAANRRMPYTGPKYDVELAALEAALSTQPLLSDQPGGVRDGDDLTKAWPATKEEMDAYWKAYSENRVHGEGAAIRAGLQAYQAALHPEQAKDGASG